MVTIWIWVAVMLTVDVTRTVDVKATQFVNHLRSRSGSTSRPKVNVVTAPKLAESTRSLNKVGDLPKSLPTAQPATVDDNKPKEDERNSNAPSKTNSNTTGLFIAEDGKEWIEVAVTIASAMHSHLHDGPARWWTRVPADDNLSMSEIEDYCDKNAWRWDIGKNKTKTKVPERLRQWPIDPLWVSLKHSDGTEHPLPQRQTVIREWRLHPGLEIHVEFYDE